MDIWTILGILFAVFFIVDLFGGLQHSRHCYDEPEPDDDEEWSSIFRATFSTGKTVELQNMSSTEALNKCRDLMEETLTQAANLGVRVACQISYASHDNHPDIDEHEEFSMSFSADPPAKTVATGVSPSYVTVTPTPPVAPTPVS